MTTAVDCVHFTHIEPPNGEMSPGRCLKCGRERDYFSSNENAPTRIGVGTTNKKCKSCGLYRRRGTEWFVFDKHRKKWGTVCRPCREVKV